ncbi:MAG: A24 family peptidase [Dehalococcoidia bacterium]
MPYLGFGELTLAVIVPAMLLACWTDLRHHRIPNWLNASLVVGGLSAQTVHAGWPGLSTGLLGMLVGFGLLILLWAVHGMGAGDVKFMAALGAWLGPQCTFYAVIVGGLAGGVIALAMILYQRSWRQASSNLGVLMMKMGSMKTAFSEFGSATNMNGSNAVLPYAIPLSIGTLVVLASDYSGWWEVL